MEKTIKIAVIGCGARSSLVVMNLIKASDRQVEVVAVYDPNTPVAVDCLKNGWWGWPDAKVCQTWQEAIAVPGVDWVFVFSPNAFHCRHVLAAFRAGKHVFSEKPLATKLSDCRKIYDARLQSGLVFATGFVLRYSPLYRAVKKLLDSGKYGRILSIQANENLTPEHGNVIIRNWRRHTAVSGPHILEKCCHDLDLINWFVQSDATRVAAFAGREFFIPKNRPLERKYPQIFKPGVVKYMDTVSAFKNDADIMDNTLAVFEYRNGVRVTFQATMANAIPERRMYIACTEGTIIFDAYSASLHAKNLAGDEKNISFDKDLHGGGDPILAKELFEGPMKHHTSPACSAAEGLTSTVLALGIDKAARTGRVVNLEPVWKKLGKL